MVKLVICYASHLLCNCCITFARPLHLLNSNNVGNSVSNNGVCMRIKRRLTLGKSPLINNKFQGKGIFKQNLMVSPEVTDYKK